MRSHVKGFFRSRRGKCAIVVAIGCCLALISEALRETEFVQSLAAAQAEIAAAITRMDPGDLPVTYVSRFTEIGSSICKPLPSILCSASVFNILILTFFSVVAYPFTLATTPEIIVNYGVMLLSFAVLLRFVEWQMARTARGRGSGHPSRLAVASILVLGALSSLLPWFMILLICKAIVWTVSFGTGVAIHLFLLFLEASGLVFAVYFVVMFLMPHLIQDYVAEWVIKMVSAETRIPKQEAMTAAAAKACGIVLEQRNRARARLGSDPAANQRLMWATQEFCLGYTVALAQLILDAEGRRVRESQIDELVAKTADKLRVLYPRIDAVGYGTGSDAMTAAVAVAAHERDPFTSWDGLDALWTALIRREPVGAMLRSRIQGGPYCKPEDVALVEEAGRAIDRKYADGPPVVEIIYGASAVCGMLLGMMVFTILSHVGTALSSTAWSLATANGWLLIFESGLLAGANISRVMFARDVWLWRRFSAATGLGLFVALIGLAAVAHIDVPATTQNLASDVVLRLFATIPAGAFAVFAAYRVARIKLR